MNWGRLIKHLLTPALRVRRCFPSPTLQRIEQAIAHSESTHSGEICFAVEAGLDLQPLWSGQAARERALEVFSELRVWDTERNNGVLLYVLMADHDIEIVADRGIAAKVAQADWDAICAELKQHFRQQQFEQGALYGIQSIGNLLQAHFPLPDDQTDRDELPNKPVLL